MTELTAPRSNSSFGHTQASPPLHRRSSAEALCPLCTAAFCRSRYSGHMLVSKLHRQQLAYPGASSRGVLFDGAGAAPADGLASHLREASVAVRSNYVGLPSMAGRGADERRRKPPGSGAQKASIRARKNGSEDTNRRGGAPKGVCVRALFANDAWFARRLRNEHRHACCVVRIYC